MLSRIDTGKLITDARKKAKLTQRELGGKMGLRQVQISYLETSARPASVRMLKRVATALDLNLVIYFEMKRK